MCVYIYMIYIYIYDIYIWYIYMIYIWYIYDIYIYDIYDICIYMANLHSIAIVHYIFHLPEAQQTTRNQSSKGMPPKSGPQKSAQTFCCSGKSSARHLTNSHLYEQNWWFQPSQKSANQFKSSVPTKWNIIENINPGALEESPCFKYQQCPHL